MKSVSPGATAAAAKTESPAALATLTSPAAPGPLAKRTTPSSSGARGRVSARSVTSIPAVTGMMKTCRRWFSAQASSS